MDFQAHGPSKDEMEKKLVKVNNKSPYSISSRWRWVAIILFNNDILANGQTVHSKDGLHGVVILKSS